MRTALNVIRDEHRSLSAVLHGLQYLFNEVREDRREPDFKVLRAMVHYIDTFPEKLHHPKEDRYLFARLRQRSTEGKAVLDQLGPAYPWRQVDTGLGAESAALGDGWPRQLHSLRR